ncbi:MAG TPA: hypothetical protein VGX76_05425, partial [Pirellulales bacterium]|nr:hypothetical protein [Pirellulales bacterium]
RGLSSLAVVGLLAGLLSPLAMFYTLPKVFPVTAVIASALALWQIAAQAPNLAGRKAALAGLFLGLMFLVAPPADAWVYRYYLRREARQFAAAWIEDVREGKVYQAHDLMIDPKKRVPPDVPPDMPLEKYYADYYSRSDYQRRMLPLFIDRPMVRTLFALGKSAEYRFYETAEEGGEGGNDFVKSTYAVTFTDEKRKKTFFISLAMSRSIDRASGRCEWTLARVDGPERPPGW